MFAFIKLLKMLWEIGLGFDEYKMLFIKYLPVLRIHLLPWISQTIKCISYKSGNNLVTHVEKELRLF